MTARLIAITPDAEKIMSFVARVSSANQDNPKIDYLLAYCIRNKHWSVFQHAFLTIEVETSRAIARQILRHDFGFSEFSQRYSEVKSEMVSIKPRSQDLKNRQNSIDDLSDEVKAEFESMQAEVWNTCLKNYNRALELGVAKECARAFLPEGLTPSKLYASESVRQWIHYIEVRTEKSTQIEHREVAEECKKVFIEHLPVVSSALGWI